MVNHYQLNHTLEDVIKDWDNSFNSLAPLDVKKKDVVIA